jgi:hypothetical protein
MGFSLMEVFTEEFFSLKIAKKDIFEVLNTFTMDKSSYEIENYRIDFSKVDDIHSIGICVDKDVQVGETLMQELIEISKVVILGDKNMIRNCIYNQLNNSCCSQ